MAKFFQIWLTVAGYDEYIFFIICVILANQKLRNILNE